MAISFVSAGAQSNLTAAGTLAPGLPAGYQAGDIFILITTIEDGNAINTPAGYTEISNKSRAAISIRVSQRIVTSSETAPTFSVSFASRAVILCYRSSLGLGMFIESFGDRDGNTSTSLTAGTITSRQSTNFAITTWGTASISSTLSGNAGYTTRFTGNPTSTALGILATDVNQTAVSSTAFTPPSASASPGVEFVNVSFILREVSTKYWVLGAGTWNTTSATNWALSSGGSGSQSIPASQDPVIIDASSGTGTITCSGAVCNDLTITASQAITLLGTSGTLSIFGSLSLPSGGSFTITGTGTITFASTSTGKTITTSGKGMPNLTFTGVGGGWTLQDALNMGGRTLTFTRATLNLNNQNVTCGTFSSNNNNTRTLTMGSGTFTLGTSANPPTTPWDVATSTNFTLNANTSTIVLRSSSDGSANNAPGSVVTFAGGGLTYNNLTFADATSNNVFNPVFAITGANTFNTIASTRTNTYTVQLPSSATTTVSTWNANGLLQNPLRLRSATTGTTGTLAVTNTFTINYAFIRDINLTVLNRGTVDNGLVVNSANWALGLNSSFGAILTSGTSWTVPSSWTSGNNTVHIFGGGGGGSGGIATTVAGGAGGGGGGYAQLVNYSASPSSVIRNNIGAGGGGGAGTASSSTGVTGGTTGFDGTAQTISFVSSAVSVQNTAATTITATVPSVSNGNLMILIVNSSSDDNGLFWSVPAGWTAPVATANGRRLFWRIASSEPASYTITQNDTQTADAIILVFSNAVFNTTGLAAQSSVSSGNPIQPVNISVETSSTIVYVASSTDQNVTFTTPTGYTSRAVDSDATGPSCSVFTLANVAEGTYTAPTTTASASNKNRAYVLSLTPVITSFTASATGGSGGSSATGPTSTGGAGGTGSGGSVNYTGGTGGAGAISGTNNRTGGGGGGAAGPNGNGGNGGAGGGGTGATTCGAGGGGGNGGGTAGGAGSSVARTSGAGGNNSLGTGGGAALVNSGGDGSSGTNGGGGSGAADNSNIGGTGGDGIDIAGVIGSGGGSGGGTQTAQTQSAGLYGGGGGGGGVASGTPGAGGSGAQGAIIIIWGTTSAVTATGNFFFLFM